MKFWIGRMRLLSMLIGVSGASQHTFRSEATGRTAYNTTAVTFNGTGRVFPMSEEQDSDATANDGKNQQENKSSTDQQDEKNRKGGTITGFTQKAFLPANANIWEEGTTLWFALIIIGSTIIGFCLGGFLCSILNRQHRRNRQRKQSEQVFWYINEIDIDNLDIRRSPVGGFHISYLNAFAKGEIAPTVASGDGGGTREIEPSPKRPFQANIFANKLERKRHKQSPKSQSQRISMAYPSDQVGRDAKRKMFDNRAFVARI